MFPRRAAWIGKRSGISHHHQILTNVLHVPATAPGDTCIHGTSKPYVGKLMSRYLDQSQLHDPQDPTGQPKGPRHLELWLLLW